MNAKILPNNATIFLALFVSSISFNATANDCSLVTKFSFAAAESYARGIPENSFVTSTFAGFMSGHRELLDNPKANLALTQGLTNIYVSVARMGSALQIRDTLKGTQSPSEALRKKITNIAQLQLGLCMGDDDRQKPSKSEACVDAALGEIATGRVEFKNSYKALGKCGNG